MRGDFSLSLAAVRRSGRGGEDEAGLFREVERFCSVSACLGTERKGKATTLSAPEVCCIRGKRTRSAAVPVGPLTRREELVCA